MTWRRYAAALTAGAMIIFSEAGAAGFADYLKGGEIPSLKERYAGKMEIGIPAEAVLKADGEQAELAALQCSLLLCEGQTGGGKMLDRGSSKKKKDPERAKVVSGKTGEALEAARQAGMGVRAGTVVCPEVPEWFFNKGYSTNNGDREKRDTLVRRMENAIRDQMGTLNRDYGDVIREWTVVRTGRDGEKDLFLETVGEDYIRLAFAAAREAAGADQKLLWDVGMVPDEETLKKIKALFREGLLDGIALECSLDAAEIESGESAKLLRRLAEAGPVIHLRGLEIRGTDRTAAGQMRLASCYKGLFAEAESLGKPEGGSVGSISLPELKDLPDRKEKGTPQRLFSEKGRCNPAFFGAMQDEAVPMPGDPEAIATAAGRLNLEAEIKKEEEPVIAYKKPGDHNPVMVHEFGADPWAMVYGDRVYLYMTGDDPAVRPGEKPKTNDYSNIVTIRVLSSADLVNWEDHGSIRAAGSTGAAGWAGNSWAPCAAWKNIDGKDRFFLYFANSGGGIGVLAADSPTGPFTDPIGKPLVSRNTPTCAEVTWLFDPAVLTDEDGSAYLYFGGGVPEGKAADPGTARAVKLAGDMIHLEEDPVRINPPWLFEDSGINRFGDTYVYSYCTNFQVPSGGSREGFGSGEIVYMTSDSPMGPFTYRGRVLRNPGFFFGTGGNNHHCMFRFRDQWYITYHAATVDRDMGWNAGYRSTFVDRLELDENGLPAPSRGTYAGVEQVRFLNPFRAVPASTTVSMAGAATRLAREEDRKAGTGKTAVISTSSGGWAAAAGCDFGETGAKTVRITGRAEVPSRIEILADDPDGTPAAVLEMPAGEDWSAYEAPLETRLTGLHDLYFRFTESGAELLEWQFRAD